jgi:hypothetical protein
MKFTINHLLAQDPYTLEVFADYLEENAPQPCFYLFLRTQQHEEKGFSDTVDCEEGDDYYVDGDGWGSGYGCSNGDGYGNGCGYGYGYGYGYDDGDGRGCGYGYGMGNGRGYGDEEDEIDQNS